MSQANPLPISQDSHGGQIKLLDFVVIVVQLGLVLLLFRQYQIENSAFLLLAQIAFAGFLIHSFLPLRYRLAFFAILSLAGTAVVLGVSSLAWLIAIGTVLVGICHLPVSFLVRCVLLAAAGCVLAMQRVGAVSSPWSEAIWPILGSMFMFRLIVYLYDQEHDKTATSLTQKIAYFFMLPNASFPLFPVVDYQSFRRNYYDGETREIYQRGIDWMVRGVIHLLLYRLVYYHFTLAPAEVTSPDLLIQYVVSNFLLYLKVSGLFHLIVGMLYLFGFRLPETHNRYFLAAGFSDLWRRINIYWKDFMQKIFYYPALFRLKRYGSTTAIVVATLWVFLLTWFLHAYQWFWIRGTMLFVVQDILFWVILGLLVVANSLYEMKYGRKRSLGTKSFSWQDVGILTLKSYVTFWFVCILWSFWTAEKVDDWLSLWQALSGDYTASVLLWPLAILVIVFLGNIPVTKSQIGVQPAVARRAWLRDRAYSVVAIVMLIAISIEPVFSKFGVEASTIIHSVRQSSLSRLDAAKMERGYYEALTDVTRFNSQLWETYAKRPANWLDNQGGGLKRFVGGFAQTEMIPSFVFNSSYGTITTNRWGLRDQEYTTERPAASFRAAVLGASTVMGWGVPDRATFESLVEQRLNQEFAGNPFAVYELLNYGVQGYQPPQQLVNFERALAMHPNAVMYIATGRELTRSVNYLAEVMRKGIEVPYPELQDIITRAGVNKGMREVDAQRRLAPFATEILTFVYRYIGDRSRSLGIQPIWIFLPQLREGSWQEETGNTVKIAEQAGFIVIRLDTVYKGKEIENIRLAEWDEHPNIYGHRLIADELFARIREDRERIFSFETGVRERSEPHKTTQR